jgi:DNA-binding CsgD family transcriptional regulator
MGEALHNNRRNLAPQELACLTLLLEGKTNKEIARALELSPATVASYLKAVYRKLGTQSRTHAVAVAIREGLITFEEERSQAAPSSLDKSPEP